MSTEEGLDNTNAVASIIETGDLFEVNMILGNRERVRHAGVIRPGIKIPLASCTKEQQAVYARMLDEGHGFDEIDAEMLKIAPKGYDKKTCLRPANSDYFTIRDEDFKRPADAEYIRSHYADSDGKVRRIPCWLPLSDIEKVVPHNFRAFGGAANLRCVSFYDGSKLKFRYLPKDHKGPAKPEDWRVLDSDDEEAASKACGYKVVFGGMYRVYVPGVRSAGEIVVPTRSWYGMGEAVAILRRVRSILGRFDGLFQGQSFFELVKSQETVKTPDGKRQQQWIVTLELSVDPMELARYAEPQAVAARSAHAMRMLTGGQPGAASVVASSQVPVVSASATTLSAEPAPVVHGNEMSSEPHLSAGENGDQPGLQAGDKQPALDALNTLIAPHGLFMADMETLYVSMHSGVEMAEATMDELRKFYGAVLHQLKTNTERFVLDLKGMRA